MSSGDLIDVELRDAPLSAYDTIRGGEPDAIREANVWGTSLADVPASVEEARKEKEPMFDVPTPLLVDVELNTNLDSGKVSDIVSVLAGATVLLGA